MKLTVWIKLESILDPFNPKISRNSVYRLDIHDAWGERNANLHLKENFTQDCNFIKKETLAQVFSCEFCKISKNTFYYKTPLVAASDSFKPFWFETKTNIGDINSSSKDVRKVKVKR